MRLSSAGLAKIARIDKRQVRRLRNGHQTPSRRTRALLTRAASDYARTYLGPDAPPDDVAACAAFVRSQDTNRLMGSQPSADTTGRARSLGGRTCHDPLSPNPVAV
jgi:hypothetical protein